MKVIKSLPLSISPASEFWPYFKTGSGNGPLHEKKCSIYVLLFSTLKNWISWI